MKIHESYLNLIKQFPLTVITSEEELDASQVFLDKLLTTTWEFDPGELQYLEVLSELIILYEDVHYSIGDLSEEELEKEMKEMRGDSDS